jgi:DNA adenine methylase
MTKPVLKTVGGKTRLLDELIARMPASYGRYYEPFVGGGALFFKLQPESAVIGDLNADLVVFYLALRDDVEMVIKYVEQHREAHDATHYYATRADWNAVDRRTWSPAFRAATYLYLNKSCFNGLWRVNKSGGFNVPIGRYKTLSLPSPDHLREACDALALATIMHAGFQTTVANAKRGDFVYFDPPYVPVSETADFTAYTVDGFTDDDQQALATLARSLVARGVHVMLSNSDTPRVRELYAGFTIDTVKCGRAINSKADRRGDVDEVIIT